MSGISQPVHVSRFPRFSRHVAVLVFSSVALLFASATTRAEPPPLFSFVQISDTHLYDDAWIQEQRAKGMKEGGYRNPLTTPGKLRTALTWIDAQAPAPAFVLLTGDIIETANPTRYAALTALTGNFRTPWALAAGNHDYGIESLLPPDGSHGGKDVVLSRNGVHFLGLATFNSPGMSQCVSRETLAKIAAFCTAHRQEPVVLFCHVPPVTSKGEAFGGMVPANAAQVQEVVKRCGNVVAVLCGHDHSLWFRVDGGILTSCGPGFCDTLGGVLPYSFRVWRVYPERLEGVVEHVTADDQVRQTDGVSVTLPWPAGLRPRDTAESAPVCPAPLPTPTGDPLADWFGPDWIAVPGFETPGNWREDTVLVPGKQAKAARMLAGDEKTVPPADAQGRAWFHPDYAEPDTWQTSSLPAVYWDQTHPRPGHQRLFFRVHLDGSTWKLDTLRRALLRSMVYRQPQIYLNGQPLPVGGSTGNYWDGFAVIAAEQLKAGDNVLAVSLTTSGWGGFKLDAEVAAQRK